MTLFRDLVGGLKSAQLSCMSSVWMRDVITVSLEHLWVSGEIDEDCNFIKCSVSPLWREQYMLEEFLSEGGFCLKNVFVLGSTFGGCPLLVAICLKIWALSL